MIWLGYLKIFHEQIYSNNSKINFKKNNETIWFVKLTERLVNFKLSQNIWNKIQKSSKIWQYKKSLISTIQCFLTVVAKIQCLEEILDTISRVSQIAVKVGGGMGWGGNQNFYWENILPGEGNLRRSDLFKAKTAFCEYWTSIKIKINMT